MTLFGRDSLLTSLMALPVDPSLALGTLQTLADRQGRVVDPPVTEEEPGKILHEVRLDVSSGLALGGKSAYYGSVDATPLFVMMLGAVSRWGFSPETTAALLPNADRALAWIRDYGDKDGDGFVEYARLNDQAYSTRVGKIPGTASILPTVLWRSRRWRYVRFKPMYMARTSHGHGWPTTPVTTRWGGRTRGPCGASKETVQ